jgi:hypothetical protein
LTSGTFLTLATVTCTRFTGIAFGAFGTAFNGFSTTTARITRRQATDVGKCIFKTFLARFSSSQILKITRVAIQTMDSTHIIHVPTWLALQARIITSLVLVSSCTTRQAFF